MVIIEIFSGFGQALGKFTCNFIKISFKKKLIKIHFPIAPNVYVFLASRFVLGIAAYGRFLTGNLLSKNKNFCLI